MRERFDGFDLRSSRLVCPLSVWMPRYIVSIIPYHMMPICGIDAFDHTVPYDADVRHGEFRSYGTIRCRYAAQKKGIPYHMMPLRSTDSFDHIVPGTRCLMLLYSTEYFGRTMYHTIVCRYAARIIDPYYVMLISDTDRFDNTVPHDDAMQH